jgi:hypothetical protein
VAEAMVTAVVAVRIDLAEIAIAAKARRDL